MRLYERQTAGVFIGRVTDKDGNSLEGIDVQWAIEHSPNDPDATTITDADGQYRLEVSKSYTYYLLSVFGKGWTPVSRKNILPGTVEQPKEVNFELEPGHWLEVKVVDSGEQPLSDVYVYPTFRVDRYNDYPIPGQPRSSRTDKKGHLRLDNLPGSEILLRIEKEGFSRITNKEVKIDQEVRITLKPGGIISGKVLDEGLGTPIKRFNVKIKGSYISSSVHYRENIYVERGDILYPRP